MCIAIFVNSELFGTTLRCVVAALVVAVVLVIVVALAVEFVLQTDVRNGGDICRILIKR